MFTEVLLSYSSIEIAVV